jgi:hypothetical protein
MEISSDAPIAALLFGGNGRHLEEGFVSLATADGCVQVAVRDFGKGIEEADLERIFECYRQLDDSDVTGLGLGLFISKSIIEAHGGRIWVVSRPGRGSTFFFTLPESENKSRELKWSSKRSRKSGSDAGDARAGAGVGELSRETATASPATTPAWTLGHELLPRLPGYRS